MYHCYFDKRLIQAHPIIETRVLEFGTSLYNSPGVKQEWPSYIACMCVAEDVLLIKSNHKAYSLILERSCENHSQILEYSPQKGEEILWRKINEVLKVKTLALSTQNKDKFFADGEIAVKRVNNPRPRELYFARAFNNCNKIVSLKGSIYHNKKLFMGMELASMDLFDYISEKDEENVLTDMNLFVDILEGVTYLHDNDVIHGDIKPENILVMPDRTAKLCDFDTCFFIGTFKIPAIGTLPYMAYEMLKSYPEVKHYGKEIDIWSLGCVYMSMLEKTIPYFNDTQDESHDEATTIKRSKIIIQDIEEKSRCISVSMLNLNPILRPSVHDLIKVYSRK